MKNNRCLRNGMNECKFAMQRRLHLLTRILSNPFPFLPLPCAVCCHSLAVDGDRTAGNSDSLLQKALQGNHVPGSTVRVTVEKSKAKTDAGQDVPLVIDIELRRMPSELIADQVKMMELFTEIDNHAKQEHDDIIRTNASHMLR